MDENYLYTLGQTEAPAWLAIDQTLLLFGQNRQQACERFIHFVAAGQGVDIWKNLSHQIYLGDKRFVSKQQHRIKEQQIDLVEVPHKQACPVCKTFSFYRDNSPDQKQAMVVLPISLEGTPWQKLPGILAYSIQR